MGAGGLAVFEVILTSSPAEPQLAVIVQQQQQSNKHQQPTILEAWSVRAAREMHEKLLEKEDTRKEKTEKTGKEKPAAGGKDKIHKQSKFAERLRRSFRRSEHRSLELKRPEPTPDVLQARNRGTPPLPKSTDNNNIVAWPPFSLPTQFQLPGLSLGGHINTALLLDSPDECTPPEYAYQHLSSVATTNTNTTSSSSLESNFELSELPTVFYWNSTTHIAMGGELSTAGHSSDPTQTPQPKRRPEASTQAQPQLQQQQPAVLPPSASRSCSLTSESSSVRLTRLHNFLFKSSNESTRSFQGHSNDGFTASSHNSSSGEWEQLGAYNPSSNNGPHDFTGGSFLEEDATDENETDEVATLPVESHDAGAGAYYQYTLTSPNNPFLPEITARTYHSNYEDNELQLEEHSRPENKQQTYVPHQLPTPAYSRAGSQESTHSESAMSCPNAPTPSPASSSSSTPGRHRRKLFSLNSPTRLLHSGGQQTQPIAIHQQPPHHPLDALASPSDSPNVAMLARSLNPFRKTASSPTSVPADLRSKREEFLRATMKICLVVSPPSSKLQLKSKSLTHLDGLDTSVSCQHETGAAAVSTGKTSTAAQLGQLGQGVHITSSQECFSVSFRLEASQHHDEEFIPVTKGTTLINALHPALRKRNLSFSQILITDNNPSSSYLDAGPASLSRLDEQTDVESLAGHHLIITERDGSRKTLQKAASFGSRQRPPRLLSSASTEETSEASGHKHIKQRWSSIFGVKNPQQSQLYELLSNYTKNGVPQRSAGFNFEHPSLSDSLAYLHNVSKSWRDFIECKSMSENEIKIQTAIWELVTTEIYYIHALQTVTDLFLACLEAVQEEGLLTEVDQHKLFSNVRSVCEANIKFWTLWLYPMVANSIVTHEPLRCGFFLDGFIAFASIFAPYKVYCAEQSTCQFYCKELNQNNALFTAYLAWCESQKMCNRLRLADIVVRPMQRLTKYSLLLAAIKKHMSDVEEIEAIDVMIHSVENFVFSVNNHLTMRQESERLKGVMARIESYDVLDSNNEVLDKLIKQHSQMFDLCAPMPGCPAYHVRHLFMEGDHKFKDTFGKSDVHCFLLTDILLVCKAMAKKGQGALKVIRQPFLTDHLIVHLSNNNTLNCVYLNEFQVATTAFTLQCSEAKNWYDALWRAKTIYQRLKRGISGNAGDSFRFGATSATGDSLGVRKSPINSSICSHVSSANNSHSGSVEWNDSRNISVEFEKTNSLSSDEGATQPDGQPCQEQTTIVQRLAKSKVNAAGSTSTSNTLTVQPVNHLGQSLPNLSSQNPQTNNTLLVPGTITSHSGNILLSPSHRGISYPPPSPTRVPLRRGMAFSTSTKNPPLLKTRHITSQNSINWHQIPATPTPPSPRSQHHSPGNAAAYSLQSSMPALLSSDSHARAALPLLQEQITFEKHLQAAKQPLLDPQQASGNETDV